MIKRLVKKVVRRILHKGGYYSLHRAVLPYGVDFALDVERLSRSWNVPIKVFFDVGAHIGETSSMALNMFSEAKVYAFEPHPKTFQTLCKEIGGNPRFAAQNLAVGDSNGAASLFTYSGAPYASAWNSLIPSSYQPSDGTIDVRCTTIDQFCAANRIEQIDVLKTDTEGGDLSVLRGASKMLSAGKVRFVYTEFFDMLMKPNVSGSGLVPIAEYLFPSGFRFVATYTDSVDPNGTVFVVANALFALPGR
jgi:FkbM family methyltransferase